MTKSRHTFLRRSEKAAFLFEKSEYSACLHVVTSSNNYFHFILRLRCLLRLDRHHEAIHADIIKHAEALPAAYRVSAFALIGSSFHRLNMRQAADSFFKKAYQLVDLAETDDCCAELYYYDAVRHWSDHLLSRAEELCAKVLDYPQWRAYGLALYAWIAAARGEHKRQLSMLGEALNAAPPEDIWVRASILQAYAASARELHDVPAMARVTYEAEKLEWSRDLRTREFYTYRYLGYFSMLLGDMYDASGFYYHARRLAKNTDAHQLIIAADKALSM